jgi:hypothetical protein
MAVAENQPPKKNRVTTPITFADYTRQLRQFIADTTARASIETDSAFQTLAGALFELQFSHIPPYRRFCESRGITPGHAPPWHEIPAMPTAAFKDLEVTSLAPEERTAVFHSSGTTEHRPSRHFHHAESLLTYEASLLPWFERNFLGDWEALSEERNFSPQEKPGFIILTPSPALAPNSSLVHMFETVRRELGSRDSFFGASVAADGAWTLDMDRVLFGIRKSMCANRPIALLGTAFSFVHLLDHFGANNIRYRLAEGSRVLETGGYKGRSREMPKAELHALITKHLGIPSSHIVCEYGMSELSSQAYDTDRGRLEDEDVLKPPTPHLQPAAGREEPRIFHFPPWARVRVISPETGQEVNDDETGLLQVFDLANVRSVMAVQTEDLAVRRAAGFEILGRAKTAEPRGCSLATS